MGSYGIPTIMQHSSTFTYMPNFIRIEKNFRGDGWTFVFMYMIQTLRPALLTWLETVDLTSGSLCYDHFWSVFLIPQSVTDTRYWYHQEGHLVIKASRYFPHEAVQLPLIFLLHLFLTNWIDNRQQALRTGQNFSYLPWHHPSKSHPRRPFNYECL